MNRISGGPEPSSFRTLNLENVGAVNGESTKDEHFSRALALLTSQGVGAIDREKAKEERKTRALAMLASRGVGPMDIEKAKEEHLSRTQALLASKGLPLEGVAYDNVVFKKGTTALAFVFKEGVMLAVDHSVDNSSPSSELLPQNVVALNSHMLATISGGSEYLLYDLQNKCLEHELKEGRRASVAEASKWLADTLSCNNEGGLSIGILIAAWDGSKFGLYDVDGKGQLRKANKEELITRLFFTTGSGSGFAFGSLFALYRPDLTVTEAVFVAKKVLCQASLQAPERHEFVGVYHVGRYGWCTKVYADHVGEWRAELAKLIRGRFGTFLLPTGSHAAGD